MKVNMNFLQGLLSSIANRPRHSDSAKVPGLPYASALERLTEACEALMQRPIVNEVTMPPCNGSSAPASPAVRPC